MDLAFVADYLANRKNPVQLVKHFDEVNEKNIKYPLIGQLKYDGIYCLLVCIGSELQLFSRVGKPLYMENLNGFMDGQLCNLADGVYIGELCTNELSLEVLSGYVSPNRKKPWDDVGTHKIGELGYIAFHDYLTVDELLDGHSDTSYRNRYSNLENRLQNAAIVGYTVKSTLIYDREQADAYAEDLIKRGHEGAVFKDPNADWEAGHKGYRAMKIVRGIPPLDLLCVGVVYGKGKRAGQIAALRFTMHGNEFNADLGKGWTDERRDLLTLAYQEDRGEGWDCKVYSGTLNEEMRNPVGKIWELKALQYSSTGKALRLPKVVRVREDKETPDA
ncbi:putative ATP-dependent DNA ligase [Acinetobacter phage vB_AbaP_Acibel007]|uniref:DNA ligase n=1 Tax=Acinetobacter phage vB_AbaP_Acibel007 TaxID=1481187 RepID=A0A075DXY4_9CAUD|nr:ATP-dependent DNA ligase [Acinetobacter phage vB_AbaP_Acibel007]AHY26791.1 putative ATP-dependent DNA ligase [Acinetobacter phage vB_AbaP_Acibel007]